MRLGAHEFRTAPAGAVESRAGGVASSSAGFVEGLAVPYGVVSSVMRTPAGAKFREIIEPGAMAASVKRGDAVRLYLNHDATKLLAFSRAKTMLLADSPRGVLFAASLAPTTIGRDVAIGFERGDIDGSLSWGMRVARDILEMRDGMILRRVVEATLFEITVATEEAAYSAARGTLRELDGASVSTRVRRHSLRRRYSNLLEFKR